MMTIFGYTVDNSTFYAVQLNNGVGYSQFVYYVAKTITLTIQDVSNSGVDVSDVEYITIFAGIP